MTKIIANCILCNKKLIDYTDRTWSNQVISWHFRNKHKKHVKFEITQHDAIYHWCDNIKYE
jgi:hypothetical protein